MDYMHLKYNIGKLIPDIWNVHYIFSPKNWYTHIYINAIWHFIYCWWCYITWWMGIIMLHSSPPILYHALLLLSSLPHPIYSIHRSISTHGYVWSIIILYRIEVVYKCKVFLPFHTDGYWQDISIPLLFRLKVISET